MELNHGDLTIEAPAFGPGQPTHSSAGDDTSPELRWSGVPDAAVELVLVVHDPDAPLVDGFTHWVATGIDPSTDGLPAGADEGFTAHLNEIGEPAYMGPAPPPGHGDHHYFFHLFAVDTPVEGDGLTRRQVLDAIDGHIVEQARTVGTFRDDG